MSVLGKLDLSAVPLHEPIIMGTLCVVIVMGAALLGALTYHRKWATCGASGSPRWTTSASA
jgi:cytochrome o ubiquinol oxidase subunit 1